MMSILGQYFYLLLLCTGATLLFVLCHRINTMRPKQNGRYFADGFFTCIFVDKDIFTLIKIYPKFVPKEPIGNKSTAC